MKYAHKTGIGVLCGLLLLVGGASPAAASNEGACYVKGAKRAAVQAHRAYVRAASRDREAKRVLQATRLYSSLYRADVGRWVQLARRCGWGWGDIPWLMQQMEQESKGQSVPEGSRDGILQCIGYWWSADVVPNAASFWANHNLPFPWDATSPRQTFIHARVMDKSNWWLVQ